MAILSAVAKLVKLVAKKKVIQNNIKVLTNKKQPVTKLKHKEKMLDKSIKRLEVEAAAAKTTSKDPDSIIRSIQNKKKRLPDSSKSIGVTGKDAQMMRFGRYAGADKEMVRLREAIKKAEAQPNLSVKAKAELKRNKTKLADMKRRLGKPADEKKYGGNIVKKAIGGKVYKNTVARKHGGAIGTGAALRGFGKGYKKG